LNPAVAVCRHSVPVIHHTIQSVASMNLAAASYTSRSSSQTSISLGKYHSEEMRPP